MSEFNPPGDIIEVQEVLEAVTLTEFTVPVLAFPRPEAVLLRTIAEYLDEAHEHLAVVSVQMSYIAHPHPLVHGVLCTAPAVPEAL